MASRLVSPKVENFRKWTGGREFTRPGFRYDQGKAANAGGRKVTASEQDWVRPALGGGRCKFAVHEADPDLTQGACW